MRNCWPSISSHKHACLFSNCPDWQIGDQTASLITRSNGWAGFQPTCQLGQLFIKRRAFRAMIGNYEYCRPSDRLLHNNGVLLFVLLYSIVLCFDWFYPFSSLRFMTLLLSVFFLLFFTFWDFFFEVFFFPACGGHKDNDLWQSSVLTDNDDVTNDHETCMYIILSTTYQVCMV